jgi:hypothetical protein
MVAMYIGVDPWPIPLSLDWFSWDQTGTPYISWGNPWFLEFPVKIFQRKPIKS